MSWSLPRGPGGGGGGAAAVPDAVGPFSGRSTHDAEAEGFVYRVNDGSSTDATAGTGNYAWDYVRQGASGNWIGPYRVTGAAGQDGEDFAAGRIGATVTLAHDDTGPKTIGDQDTGLNFRLVREVTTVFDGGAALAFTGDGAAFSPTFANGLDTLGVEISEEWLASGDPDLETIAVSVTGSPTQGEVNVWVIGEKSTSPRALAASGPQELESYDYVGDLTGPSEVTVVSGASGTVRVTSGASDFSLGANEEWVVAPAGGSTAFVAIFYPKPGTPATTQFKLVAEG
jgi:hypothetical protein